MSHPSEDWLICATFGLNEAQMRHHGWNTFHMHRAQPMMACPSGCMNQCHHKGACLIRHVNTY